MNLLPDRMLAEILFKLIGEKIAVFIYQDQELKTDLEGVLYHVEIETGKIVVKVGNVIVAFNTDAIDGIEIKRAAPSGPLVEICITLPNDA